MKKFVFVLALFGFIFNIKALNYRGCDSSEIARMKASINNINISYDYVMEEYPIFSITINNIQPDVYFTDSSSNKEYRYQDAFEGEIVIGGYSSGVSGKYKFFSANGECYGINLGSKYYKTPDYNPYYNDPLCEGLNIKLCEKWININYSKEDFERLIYEYKNNKADDVDKTSEYKQTIVEKIIDFYVKYYIFILLFIIITSVTVIIIKRNKDKFDL